MLGAYVPLFPHRAHGAFAVRGNPAFGRNVPDPKRRRLSNIYIFIGMPVNLKVGSTSLRVATHICMLWESLFPKTCFTNPRTFSGPGTSPFETTEPERLRMFQANSPALGGLCSQTPEPHLCGLWFLTGLDCGSDPRTSSWRSICQGRELSRSGLLDNAARGLRLKLIWGAANYDLYQTAARRCTSGRNHVQCPNLDAPARDRRWAIPDGRRRDRGRVNRADRISGYHSRARARIGFSWRTGLAQGGKARTRGEYLSDPIPLCAATCKKNG
jgi:hypothetical protein